MNEKLRAYKQESRWMGNLELMGGSSILTRRLEYEYIGKVSLPLKPWIC